MDRRTFLRLFSATTLGLVTSHQDDDAFLSPDVVKSMEPRLTIGILHPVKHVMMDVNPATIMIDDKSTGTSYPLRHANGVTPEFTELLKRQKNGNVMPPQDPFFLSTFNAPRPVPNDGDHFHLRTQHRSVVEIGLCDFLELIKPTVPADIIQDMHDGLYEIWQKAPSNFNQKETVVEIDQRQSVPKLTWKELKVPYADSTHELPETIGDDLMDHAIGYYHAKSSELVYGSASDGHYTIFDIPVDTEVRVGDEKWTTHLIRIENNGTIRLHEPTDMARNVFGDDIDESAFPTSFNHYALNDFHNEMRQKYKPLMP